MNDEQYMRRAIELARKGVGWTNPNPCVGAVVVKDGRVIGEGYHEHFGGFHAERNAILSCTEDPKGATIYVTLEPCRAFPGKKTPPCSGLIIEKELARVVIGSRDPNPNVAGMGAADLRAKGIEVVEDVLREECDELNPVFFHAMTKKRPYVVMKYAMTLDGKIASYTGASKWITGDVARAHVQELRGTYAGILVGIGTVLADDPMLNCRIEDRHQPTRIVLDPSLRIPRDCKLIKSANEYETIVVCARMDEEKKKLLEENGVTVLYCPKVTEGGVTATCRELDLRKLLDILYAQQIDSILVEGGGITHEHFLKAGLVDHVCAYIAPKVLGGAEAKTPVEGVGADCPDHGAHLANRKITVLGEDILLEYDVDQSMRRED